MKLKVTVARLDASMSIDGVEVARYERDPGTIIDIDTTRNLVSSNGNPKVRLTDGRWTWWSIDDTMPAALKVYEGSWENKRQVGWCTRQHAVHLYNRGVYYNVTHRGHQMSIRVAGDVDAFHLRPADA